MKKAICLALFGLLVFACKKSGSPGAKEQLLSAVYENDELRYDFEYMADRKLSRLKKYPQGSLTANIIYEYKYEPDGRLQQKMYINGLTGKPGTKYLYEWNNAKQLVKRLAYNMSGADSGNLSMWAMYTYNADNRMIKENHYFADDKPAGYRVWEYAANGTVLFTRLYGEKPSGSTLVELWEYTGSTNQVNPAIKKAWVEPAETELLFFDAAKIDISKYVDGSVDTKHQYQMTGRKAIGPEAQWDEQHIHYLKTFPGVQILLDTRKMKYEYVEQ